MPPERDIRGRPGAPFRSSTSCCASVYPRLGSNSSLTAHCSSSPGHAACSGLSPARGCPAWPSLSPRMCANRPSQPHGGRARCALFAVPNPPAGNSCAQRIRPLLARPGRPPRWVPQGSAFDETKLSVRRCLPHRATHTFNRIGPIPSQDILVKVATTWRSPGSLAPSSPSRGPAAR